MYPLVHWLGADVVSAWATKRHAAESTLLIEPARSTTAPEAGWWVGVETSYETARYKEQIAQQLEAAGAVEVAPGKPLTARIAFLVGPGRNWLNLSKPTIDALGVLVGEGTRPWAPQDGRITSLGLIKWVDDGLQHQVRIWLEVKPS